MMTSRICIEPSRSTPPCAWRSRCVHYARPRRHVAGCRTRRTPGTQVAGWSMVDPSQRHPIIVSQEPQTMQVRVAASRAGSPRAQRSDVLEFADRARASDAGNSRLVISGPRRRRQRGLRPCMP